MEYVSFEEPSALAIAQSVLAIPMKRFEQPIVGFVSRQHIEAILAAPNTSTWTGQRNHIMLTTLYNTGARVSELLEMRGSDLVFGPTSWVRIHGKGRKERSVPLWPDTAKELRHWMRQYASLPSHTYFAGGSGGGREAFAAFQKWPLDYDGVIAFYPAWPLNEMLLNYGKVARAWAAPDAYIDVAKQTLLYNAEISACDALDGVTDGNISNVTACTFSPAALRCPGGADAGDACLSDAQINALQAGMGSNLTLTYSVPSGETQYPAYNVFSGVDLRNGGAGTTAPGNPLLATMPFAALISAPYVRYGIVQNAAFNYLPFDPLNPGIYQSAVASMSTLLDMNATDLSAFMKRGGKLLLVHGAADATIPTASSEQYFARVTATMGASAVGSFFKFYEVPGYAHGFGQFNASWDSVSALEGWVEHGTAPVSQTVMDANPGTPVRSRPLCEYPLWPKYTGSGDQNTASSYTCASS